MRLGVHRTGWDVTVVTDCQLSTVVGLSKCASSLSKGSLISVLKSGPVRFFISILRQLDRNWSFYFPDLRQPDRDRSRPVHVGPHSSCKPVATGL